MFYFSPLHIASEFGHISLVEYLVNQNAEINSKDENNRTPLHLAARNGHLCVVMFLTSHHADINVPTYGYPFGTPLYFAADYDHLSVVEYLLHLGAEYKNGFKNKSYLHWSASKGYLSVVKYLVSQKTDMNPKDNSITTPLHEAAKYGHLSVVECLVDNGADINSKNKKIRDFCLIILLFMKLQNMVIVALLSALLTMEQILMQKIKMLVLYY